MSPETMVHLRDGIAYIVALILSICLHEFGHAWVADRLGDPLPRAQGRVTLNPFAHVDPIGTLLLPALAVALSLSSPGLSARIVGWGKPVQVSLPLLRMTRRFSIGTSDILISIAGPAMNLLFALVLSGLYVVLLRVGTARTEPLVMPVAQIVAMNIGLAFFNLIPVPPLDGGHVAARLLERNNQRGVADLLRRYGGMLFFALLMSGVLQIIMVPAYRAAVWWLQQLTHWVAA